MPWSSTIAPIASPWAVTAAIPATPPPDAASRRPKQRPELAEIEVELVTAEVDLTDDEAIRRLHARAHAMIEPRAVRRLSLDVRSVAVADSKLIACLVALHRLARSRGVAMEVRIAPQLRQLFTLFRLECLLAAPTDGCPESRSA